MQEQWRLKPQERENKHKSGQRMSQPEARACEGPGKGPTLGSPPPHQFLKGSPKASVGLGDHTQCQPQQEPLGRSMCPRVMSGLTLSGSHKSPYREPWPPTRPSSNPILGNISVNPLATPKE